MHKTPDEIKKGLACCAASIYQCADDCPYKEECRNGQGGKAMMEDTLALIQQLEAKVPRWISVEERLPEKGIVVLAMWHGEMAFARYTPHRLGWYNLDTRYDSSNAVTHWMPLPEPPKEE